MKNPFWRFEVVIVGNRSETLLFGTTKHFFRDDASRAAVTMRHIISEQPETEVFTVTVKKRGWQRDHKAQ